MPPLNSASWRAPARHPHRVSHYGYLLFRPRPPLGFFDDGVTPQTGSTVFLEAHRQNSMNFADASQADAPLGFGTLSMALVLQLVVPLVVFMAAAGTVARDRQDGTLALLLAQGARWSARDLPTRAEFEADVERRTRALGDSHNPNDEKFAAFKALSRRRQPQPALGLVERGPQVVFAEQNRDSRRYESRVRAGSRSSGGT